MSHARNLDQFDGDAAIFTGPGASTEILPVSESRSGWRQTMRICPLKRQRLPIAGMDDPIGIAMPDGYYRPSPGIRRGTPHQVAPFLRG